MHFSCALLLFWERVSDGFRKNMELEWMWAACSLSLQITFADLHRHERSTWYAFSRFQELIGSLLPFHISWLLTTQLSSFFICVTCLGISNIHLCWYPRSSLVCNSVLMDGFARWDKSVAGLQEWIMWFTSHLVSLLVEWRCRFASQTYSRLVFSLEFVVLGIQIFLWLQIFFIFYLGYYLSLSRSFDACPSRQFISFYFVLWLRVILYLARLQERELI